MLTNEQLFELVADGNEDLKPVLWERVKKFLYMQADKYYSRYKNYCDRHGVEAWDLRQQAYIAFLNSFAGFDIERGGYLTYLDYAFKSSLRELFKPREPMNAADRLDRSLEFDNGSDITVADTVPDPTASEELEAVDDMAEREQIGATNRAAVDSLEDKEREIVKAHWFDSKSLKQIGADQGVSVERIRQIERKAFDKLRKDKNIRKLYNELGYGSSRLYHDSYGNFQRYGSSAVEYIAISRADIQNAADKELLRHELRERAYMEWTDKKDGSLSSLYDALDKIERQLEGAEPLPDFYKRKS